MGEPSTAKLTSMHFYAWKKGLKTGMYYLRTRPKADAIAFTVDQTALAETKKADAAAEEDLKKNMSNVSIDKENTVNVSTGAIKGLDVMEEPACANCSA